ncbi:MAG: hypothetical protein Q4F31_00250 [Eubacteriales bacterium]|nr:hypothetical protein [Eubacteriales bacterium]
MKKKVNVRSLCFKIGFILILLIISAVMLVIGRGHTIYLDNKKAEINGTQYDAYRKITVYVNGEKLAKLSAKDRGMAENMGQTFSMTLEYEKEKGDEAKTEEFTLKLPYNLDGIVVNLPALLEGVPQEDCMSEFVSLLAADDTEEEEEIVTDEFALGDF